MIGATLTAAPRPATAAAIAFTDAGVSDLTDREREIIELITNGFSNKEIAERLHLGLNTVKTHVRVGYRKIGARTRTHAVVWGARHGLLAGFDPSAAPAPPECGAAGAVRW
jgi:NarL family two-component system response regulator LiaR